MKQAGFIAVLLIGLGSLIAGCSACQSEALSAAQKSGETFSRELFLGTWKSMEIGGRKQNKDVPLYLIVSDTTFRIVSLVIKPNGDILKIDDTKHNYTLKERENSWTLILGNNHSARLVYESGVLTMWKPPQYKGKPETVWMRLKKTTETIEIPEAISRIDHPWDLIEVDSPATAAMEKTLTGTWTPVTINGQVQQKWAYPCWKDHFIEIGAGQCIWHSSTLGSPQDDGTRQCIPSRLVCKIVKDRRDWGLTFDYDSFQAIDNYFELTDDLLKLRFSGRAKPGPGFIANSQYRRATAQSPSQPPADSAKPKEQTK